MTTFRLISVGRRTCLFLFSLAWVALFFNCKQAENEAEAAASKEKPEDNRFTKTILTQGMDEPMEMAILHDGRILICERKGGLKVFDTKTNQIRLITTIPVNTKYVSKEGFTTEAEEGLVGIVAHPDFDKNHWIYLYFADPVEKAHVLARYELHGDSLYLGTKKVVISIPTQREVCCHTGGGMVFDKDGNLFLTVGNNTANPPSGTFSMDERPGRESWDDQRGSGNTNNLHGKILRIHPEDNGSYTIPEGNLFPKGMARTRPEIYVMGNRNPWRVSLDSKTGYLYWGEVGPDASSDSIWGSRGYDEFNQARKPGYFGWPYFIGDNRPYRKYNPADSSYGALFDPAHPVNNSRNNDGLKELPPPQKAFIWYPYANSDTFPLLGSSGRSAVGGPIFHRADFKDAKRPFPAYYEDKWLITDFMRGWIMSVTMKPNGDYESMEPFLPNENISSVLDMKFSQDGDLYVLEYGSAWFKGNANSALVRFQYNGGNRKPVVGASADRLAGAIPFKVKLSSQGTMDFDKYDSNKLKYEWKINSNNQVIQTSSDPNPEIVLDKPGIYEATLTVTDTKGESNSRSLQLQAGNEPPEVAIQITKGNKSFFFPGKPIEYAIEVKDKEDGSAADGKIKPDEVATNFDYVPKGFDLIEIAQHHRAADDRAGFSAGLYLINQNDCKTCHMPNTKSVGPSYFDVAERYKHDPAAAEKLAGKVISGGSGNWGDHAMAGHPTLSKQEAAYMVKYILSVSQKSPNTRSMPLKGSFDPKIPTGENGEGGFLLRAAYKDKGASGITGISTESTIALRNPNLDPEHADEKKGTQLLITPSKSFFMTGDKSYVGYNKIDMSGIRQIEFLVMVVPSSGAIGGTIEVHLDAPDGKLIGKTTELQPKPIDYAVIMKLMGDRRKNAKNAKNNAKADDKKKKSGDIDVDQVDMDFFRKLLSVKADAALDATNDVHDVYIVFRNPGAAPSEILMDLIGLNFQTMSGTTSKGTR